MVEYDLSVGTGNLTRAFSKCYPHLKPAEIQALGNVILTEVSTNIAKGNRLAFVSTDQAGNSQIAVINLNVRDK